MKARHVPLRTCVVCRQTSDKKTLLRVVRRPDKDGGGVCADASGRASGRGSYVCADADCIARAVKQKRFERSLSVSTLPAELSEQLLSLIPPPTTLSAGANQ